MNRQSNFVKSRLESVYVPEPEEKKGKNVT